MRIITIIVTLAALVAATTHANAGRDKRHCHSHGTTWHCH